MYLSSNPLMTIGGAHMLCAHHDLQESIYKSVYTLLTHPVKWGTTFLGVFTYVRLETWITLLRELYINPRKGWYHFFGCFYVCQA